MSTTILFSLLALSLQLLSANAVIKVQSTCGPIPVVDTSGPGCSIPAFVDPEEFGDNLQSSGRMIIRPTPRGSRVLIQVDGLSRPDLVLTAWIVWADPGETLPEIFQNQIANIVSPVAASTAGFTSGLGPDPNRLRYVSRTRAVLKANLDFDFTKPNSGFLVGARPSFQSDIPGLEGTPLEPFTTPDGQEIPVSATFLRVFDPETGFQNLNARGRPELVRSPTSAYGVAVVAHTDKTTHGLSAGIFLTDHFEILFFKLTDIESH